MADPVGTLSTLHQLAKLEVEKQGRVVSEIQATVARQKEDHVRRAAAVQDEVRAATELAATATDAAAMATDFSGYFTQARSELVQQRQRIAMLEQEVTKAREALRQCFAKQATYEKLLEREREKLRQKAQRAENIALDEIISNHAAAVSRSNREP